MVLGIYGSKPTKHEGRSPSMWFMVQSMHEYTHFYKVSYYMAIRHEQIIGPVVDCGQGPFHSHVIT